MKAIRAKKADRDVAAKAVARAETGGGGKWRKAAAAAAADETDMHPDELHRPLRVQASDEYDGLGRWYEDDFVGERSRVNALKDELHLRHIRDLESAERRLLRKEDERTGGKPIVEIVGRWVVDHANVAPPP